MFVFKKVKIDKNCQHSLMSVDLFWAASCSVSMHQAVLTIFICFNFLKTNILFLLSLTYYFIINWDNIGKLRCI
jgi:hypothetical protein